MSFEAPNVRVSHIAVGDGHAISPAQQRCKLVTNPMCQSVQESPGGCVITPCIKKGKEKKDP